MWQFPVTLAQELMPDGNSAMGAVRDRGDAFPPRLTPYGRREGQPPKVKSVSIDHWHGPSVILGLMSLRDRLEVCHRQANGQAEKQQRRQAFHHNSRSRIATELHAYPAGGERNDDKNEAGTEREQTAQHGQL